jgi:N6-adenosine-specific RNA methylase IME4
MNEVATVEPAAIERRDEWMRDAAAALAVVEKSRDPEKIIEAERRLETLEHMMRQTGLFKSEEIRVANDGKLRARWRLGQLLAKVERAKAPGKGKMASASLTSLLGHLRLDKQTAVDAQRIGTLPANEFEKALKPYRGSDYFVTFTDLLRIARPYWYKESRKRKHRKIHQGATALVASFGPFPLIYADPPWRFEIYSEKGQDRTPDQHYPTLGDQDIIDFSINGQRMSEVAHKDAALLLWCTSSNLKRALAVMEGWGFEYKASAVWDKEKTGLGLVFRNQHELLLYGTRGAMPGPQHQPPSVFRFPRGEHSAKPPEIRKEIERMYPDFDAETRLELFARETVDGWTAYGYESKGSHR